MTTTDARIAALQAELAALSAELEGLNDDPAGTDSPDIGVVIHNEVTGEPPGNSRSLRRERTPWPRSVVATAGPAPRPRPTVEVPGGALAAATPRAKPTR